VDESLTWKFKSLWQQTKTEKAELYSKVASADAIYLDRGVISPSQVAERFESEEFQTDLMIEKDEEIQIPDNEAEQILSEIKKDIGMKGNKQ
jgi:hypothetical protein